MEFDGKYIVFDFGGTLAEYRNLPKAWNGFYMEAFTALGKKMQRDFSPVEIQSAIDILSKYNARLHPRENEISDQLIFEEINSVLKTDSSAKNLAISFYSFFQDKLVIYEETTSVLKTLRENGFTIGVLSDLPTAMPHECFIEDIKKINFKFDTVQSSQSTGWRKPNIQGISKIADIFGCLPSEIIYIGDEKKDMELINKAGGTSVLINRDSEEKAFGQKFTIKSLGELIDTFHSTIYNS